MQSKSFKAASIEGIAEQLKATTSIDFKPTLALVYVHVHFSIEDVRAYFLTTGLSFIGASSAGEFVDEVISEPSIVVHLFDIKTDAFKLFFSDDTTEQNAIELGQIAKQHYEEPAVIILISGVMEGEAITTGIAKGAQCFVPAFGGLAAEDLKMESTYIFSNEGISEHGIAAVIIDTEKIAVHGLICGGWRPMGIIRTITKSAGNVVYTIDDEPALNLIARYSRQEPEEFKKREAVVNLSTRFQLLVYRPDNYPVIRAPLNVNYEERSVLFSGTMPEGSQIQFSLAPSFEAIDNVVSEYSDLKSEFEDPEAVLLFSCKARQMILGPWVADEVERIRTIWEAPISGFFCYGEIGITKNKTSEFHGMSCSVLLLKENSIS